jgi:hypothetical protein
MKVLLFQMIKVEPLKWNNCCLSILIITAVMLITVYNNWLTYVVMCSLWDCSRNDILSFGACGF